MWILPYLKIRSPYYGHTSHGEIDGNHENTSPFVLFELVTNEKGTRHTRLDSS